MIARFELFWDIGFGRLDTEEQAKYYGRLTVPALSRRATKILFPEKTLEGQWQYLRDLLERYSLLANGQDNDLLASLLVKMLARDPSQRPTVNQALEDDFFKPRRQWPENEIPDTARAAP